jgi:replicative DNA helicase
MDTISFPIDDCDGQEMALLCSIFLLPSVLDDISLLVTKDDFFYDRNSLVFQYLLDRHLRGLELSVEGAIVDLKERGVEDLVPFVQSLLSTSTNARHAISFAMAIHDRANDRRKGGRDKGDSHQN